MNYVEHEPNGQLGKYIDKLWYCQSEAFSNSTLAIPLLHHELVFNFSDYYCIKQRSGKMRSILNPRAWVNGIQTTSYSAESKGRHEMLGVLFKANGLSAFTKFASGDFTDQFVDATLIFDSTFPDLINSLQNNQNYFLKIALVEKYLLQQLKHDTIPAYLTSSLELLTDNCERIKIREISKKVSITHKSLINCFQRHIGLSPAKYWHVSAINTALNLLAKEPEQSTTQLAHKLNFYDQSHFIHSFQSVTGLTPSRYKQLLLAKKVDQLSPNFISLGG